MNNYNAVVISAETLAEWKNSYEQRFNKLAALIGPGLAYHVVMDDWTRIGRERGNLYVRQAKLEEEEKILRYKLRALAKLQQAKDKQAKESKKV